MISMKEILKNVSLESLPKEHQDNLKILLEKANVIRSAYGKPLTVSSGYRSLDDHLRIYKEKGIIDQSKIPMASKHLYGQAIDFADPKQELQKWILANIKILEDNGIFCEDFSATVNWLHMQILPPKSGKRFFLP